jgi:GT2 family glycosyltransferase
MKPILAVVVLYRIGLDVSPACRAIQHEIAANPDFGAAVDLLLADNSAEPQSLPAGFIGRYLHDGNNEGLALRYNTALDLAAAAGATWLLLFDQDTTPTPDYYRELLALSASLADDLSIAAIVPKLVMHGEVISPHIPRYLKVPYIVDAQSSGVLGEKLRAYNSGALVRVSALRSIGGFPRAYWLDYLDHATFHRLQQNGGRIFVMQASLEHELSESIPNKPPNLKRVLSRLRSEHRFYSEHGSASEWAQHRIDLIRQVLGLGRRGRFAEALLRLKVLLHLP